MAIHLLLKSFNVICMIMRVFLMLIIFALVFSGYSAAVHAFGKESCNPVAVSDVAENSMDMSDCPGHQAKPEHQQDSQTDKTAKGKCMDCTHCCASHAINLLNHAVDFPSQAAVLNPPPVNGFAGEYLFSLLRPPKSLV